jgi:hypothetical protein
MTDQDIRKIWDEVVGVDVGIDPVPFARAVLNALPSGDIEHVAQVLACEVECSIFEQHIAPALEVARKALSPTQGADARPVAIDETILANQMQFGSDMATKYSRVCQELAALKSGALDETTVDQVLATYNNEYCEQRKAGQTGGTAERHAMQKALCAFVGADKGIATRDATPSDATMPNLDGDWSPISETLVHRLRDPIPAQALADMPERMAEAINVITEEAADAIESLCGQFRELEYIMECSKNAKSVAALNLNLESGLGDGGLLDANIEAARAIPADHSRDSVIEECAKVCDAMAEQRKFAFAALSEAESICDAVAERFNEEPRAQYAADFCAQEIRILSEQWKAIAASTSKEQS